MPRLSPRTVILTLLFASASLACFGQAPSLANVRKVYVEPMENHLDQYLTSEISRQFHGSLQIVTSAAQADAVLKGVNLGAQSTNKATVNLVDPTGKIVLWSGTAADREGKFLDVKHGGLQAVASHLIHELHKAMQSR
ncbi:MAG: hypothetical protein WA824_04350 [Candidatus Sulfotelmatobacter sp.]